MIYKLHYAEKALLCDIKTIKFKTLMSLYNHVIEEIGKDFKTVYLLSVDDEVVITESLAVILEVLSGNVSSIAFLEDEKGICNVFLQEYESYQDAYEVALYMKETNPLCYDKERMPPPPIKFTYGN